jgi:hypothetical protein
MAFEKHGHLGRHPPPFQVYVLANDDGSSRQQLDTALALGVGALVVTVDANAPRHGALHRATAGATGVFPSPSFDARGARGTGGKQTKDKKIGGYTRVIIGI